MSSYWLGIDLGTTFTAAAICWPVSDGLEVQVVPLSSHSHAIPSVLFLPGDGSLVVGEGAERRSLTDPDRVAREFKPRVGDEIPLLVAGSAYFAHDLAAEFVSWLWHYVADREGERPAAVALTCPASWGPYKTGLFQQAVRDAGVQNVMVLSEPQAAAISYASRERVEVGATLAVYDLGGGTFDAAVVRKDSPTQFTVLGQPEGIPTLGGLSFDEVIFEYVCGAAGVAVDELDRHDPGIVAEVARLRRECTEAKEALSADTDAIIPVTLGGTQHWVRLTRAEFEEMIRPDLDRTIDALHRALGTAGVSPGDLDAILLIGGSSRIPLVSQLVAAGFGRAPSIDADPKAAVAMGAARFPAPANAPVRDTVETAAVPLRAAPPDWPGRPDQDIAPAERPEMVSLLAAGPDEAGRPGGPGPSGQRTSRKALAGVAAVVVLVVAGGITALRTPMLSDLLSHHGGTDTTSAGASATPTTSSSPAPSAQPPAKPAKPASFAGAGATTGSNGTVVSLSSTKAAAKTSSKSSGSKPQVTATGKTPVAVRITPPHHGQSMSASASPSSSPPVSPSASPPVTSTGTATASTGPGNGT